MSNNRPRLNRFVANRHMYEHKDVVIQTPDEWTRRVGQSMAAASLPKLA